ncbi:MAG TPA: hypothetical protein VEA58_06595, partial [Anaerovoracaceae bacterium]|nr:hypothetical protein [Anaerovoracaceae bacterium]
MSGLERQTLLIHSIKITDMVRLIEYLPPALESILFVGCIVAMYSLMDEIWLTARYGWYIKKRSTELVLGFISTCKEYHPRHKAIVIEEADLKNEIGVYQQSLSIFTSYRIKGYGRVFRGSAIHKA